MTKQEAITILTASDYFWLRPSENEVEALNMAIEALKENKKERREKPPISPPTLQCNDCTRYFYCAMDERDSEDCPRYKPKEESEE